MTITKETWAEQKSNTIPKNNGQPRVNKQGKTQETQNLPVTLAEDTHTKEPQKIVASTTNPPVVVSPPTSAFVKSSQPYPRPLPKFIMQEEDHSKLQEPSLTMKQERGWSFDNTSSIKSTNKHGVIPMAMNLEG